MAAQDPAPAGGTPALEDRSTAVIDAIGIGFWWRDLDADRLYWDPRMYALHQRDPSRGPPAFADWLEEHVHPDDRPWIGEMQRRAVAAWQPVVDCTFRIVRPGGDVRWVQSWTRRSLGADGRRLAMGMHIDVTDRENAQGRARRERDRTLFAIEAAAVGVWERALDGRTTYWNDAMFRLRGLTPEDPRSLDRIVRDTTHPDDLGQLGNALAGHLEHGHPYRFEFRVRHADGGWRWLATQGMLLRDEQGAPVGIAGVNLDITARREAEALRAEWEAAERAARDRAALLARMSHELRTPMNAVLGFTQLMAEDTAEPPSPRQRERLAQVRAAGQRLMALIDDLLELTAPPPALPPAPAEPEPLVVLCVEDNEVNRMLVREILATRPGVQLLEAEDATRGLAMARAHRPAIALIDVQLPDFDGIELLRRLRTDPAMVGCTCIALSANAMPEQIERALAAGFDDYWTKPIDMPRFIAGIERYGARRSRVQAPGDAGSGR